MSNMIAIEKLYEKSISDFNKVLNSLTEEEKTTLLYYIFDDSVKKEILLTLSDENKLKHIEALNVEFFMHQILLTVKDKDIKKELELKIMDIHSKRLNSIKLKEIFDQDKIDTLKENINVSNFDRDISNKTRFGIELEVTGGFSNLILMDTDDFFHRWDKNLDISLPYNSMEIISPILNYKIDDLKEIYLICKFLKENELSSSDKCAFHIHIDRDYLNKDKRYLFYLLFSYYEEIFYLITNERGSLPREYIKEYAKPISFSFNKINSDTPDDKILEDIKRDIQHYDKNYSVNVVSPKGYNTIEFRMPNGTIDFDSIHQDIKLFIKFIDLVNKSDFSIIDTIKDMDEEERLVYLLNESFNLKDMMYFYNRYIINRGLLNNKSVYQRYFRRSL